MRALFCELCGKSRGKHQAFSYNCPTGENSYHSRDRFTLRVQRLSCDDDTAALLASETLTVVEQEIVRRVIKQIEQIFECYQLGRTYTQEEIIEGIDLIRKGYGL
jgi:uncharacterized hydantoinase/oxoprolinase family protein